MKKLISFCLISFCCSSWGNNHFEPHQSPSFIQTFGIDQLTFSSPPQTSVIYGNTLLIPVEIRIGVAPGIDNFYGWWEKANSYSLVSLPGECSYFATGMTPYCHANIVVPGTTVGSTVTGKATLCIQGLSSNYRFCYSSPDFSVEVIPHPLSMNTIEQQGATIGSQFTFDFKANVIQYYDENKRANTPTKGVITQDTVNALTALGLQFDENNLVISGKPNKVGIYAFNIGVKNKYSEAKPTTLTLNVEYNKKDKPIFKKNNTITSAIPTKHYRLNLLNLLQTNASFMNTNQITFKLDPNHEKLPAWLNFSPDSSTILEGTAAPEFAGQTIDATIIATSNTGGDSDPLTITIPVTYDATQQPTIDYFELKQLAGNPLHADIASYIKNPAQDSNLKVSLVKVEPAAPWLSISALTPTVLEGIVPPTTTGQKYLITLQANTPVGGNSPALIIPLQINIDKSQTPQFKEDNPSLPMVYPGQPFAHDFAAHEDVFPEYSDAPYVIQFAKDSKHPDWLKLENNKLFSEMVPPDIQDSRIEIKLIIKNIPGGPSDAITLRLKVMN